MQHTSFLSESAISCSSAERLIFQALRAALSEKFSAAIVADISPTPLILCR
jgi:hypothetical protein